MERASPPQWTVGDRVFSSEAPGVMGILNATPDSFSDGGRLDSLGRSGLESLLESWHGHVDIVDLGAQSTRPGHAVVGPQIEIERLQSLLALLRSFDFLVSVDTYQPDVARFVLKHGVDILNDVYGFQEPGMVQAIRDFEPSVCLMRYQDAATHDAVRTQLARSIEYALAAGLPTRKILLDPGLGFGERPGGNVEANLRLIDQPHRWLPRGDWPYLIGASRKRFVGALQQEADVLRRDAMSHQVELRALRMGAAVVRTHDPVGLRELMVQG